MRMRNRHCRYRRLALIWLCLSVLVFSGLAKAQQQEWLSWKKVGQATLSWGFWTIYDSTLYVKGEQFKVYPELDLKQTLALEITYRRDIDSEDLVEETISQWVHLGLSEQQSQKWAKTLSGMWPDILEDDQLIYKTDGQRGTFFHRRGHTVVRIGELTEEAMSDAFISIWLSPKTAYPELRNKLIGVKS
ncbi:hypothetical protein [Algicola sagamiensis]|uniref:hypothetical protein n=1 Tax=Algicola sagamiensis TaxID=163869 RepID=UPI00058AD714|nr:hypothetical protein [Algicola sagamiensis]